MLKAIAASLLMEQVLAPNFNFRAKRDDDTSDGDPRTIKIKGLREPSTKRVKNIVESDMTELKANILQDPEMVKSLSGVVDTDVINRVLIPKIIMTKYPDLSEEEVEEVREHLVADMVIRHSEISDDEKDRRFIKLVDKFINIEELDIDLMNCKSLSLKVEVECALTEEPGAFLITGQSLICCSAHWIRHYKKTDSALAK